MVNERLRTFLAMEIPADIRSELATLREEVRIDLPRARWTRPEAWHLTLKFLGDTDRERVDELAAGLRPRLHGLGSVDVRLGGSGFFPSRNRPRVAWVGGSAEGVESIVEVIDDVAANLGFARERRRWSLHLTQIRIRDRWPGGAVERFLGWGENLLLEPFNCREVVLFSSDLRPDGAVYTAMERFTLE